MTRRENAGPHRWLRVYSWAWCSLAGLVGIAGIAGGWLELGAGGSLLLLAGVAILGTFGVWRFGPQHGDGRPGPTATALGVACALGFVALVGLSYGLGPVGLGAGVVIAAAGWPVLWHRRPVARPGAARAVPAPPAGPPVESVPPALLPGASALHGLSTPELCWTWRASYVCLRRDPWPSYLECLSDLRGACLDELEHRDPAAFARWFPSARAASDPARYFCQPSQR